MLFLISLSLCISMIYMLILRSTAKCLDFIPWLYPLLGLVISATITAFVHIWSLPCWHILSSRPQRLHSFSDEAARAHIPLLFIPLSFVMGATLLLIISIYTGGCPCRPLYAGLILLLVSVVHLYIYFYTASLGSSEPSSGAEPSSAGSSSESSEASKVNTSPVCNLELDSSIETSSGISSSDPESN